MKICVGICAHNEERNIGRLLEHLIKLPKKVRSIYVVSSSVDKTNDIVCSFSRRDKRTRLIMESKRSGKTSALNVLLSNGNSYDVMLYMGADNLPEKNAIDILSQELKKPDVGVVGARGIPVNNPNSFTGFCAHLQWNLLHLSSLKHPRAVGELMAFKVKLVEWVPPAIINDDAYVQFVIESKGYKTVYRPDAIVYLKGPSTVREIIRQRRRVYTGHRQLKLIFGKLPHTMKWMGWKQILKACPFLGLKGRLYALGFILLQAIAYILSAWDFHRGKIPYVWPIAETTKSLEVETSPQDVR